MCGAACAAIGRQGSGGVAISVHSGAVGWRADAPSWREVGFQFGRCVGYTVAGAGAASVVESLAWLSAQSAALRPVWTLFHVMALAWGAMLVIKAEQPVWVQTASRSIWQRIRPMAAKTAGVFASGVLWTFLPCGLLYSALLVAGLSGSVAGGAMVMTAFALGSSLSLLLGPWLWRLLRQRVDGFKQSWGTRLAGLVLCAMAGWGLWMDLVGRIADWCR
jgi:sulfite exporter TauE/SafE